MKVYTDSAKFADLMVSGASWSSHSAASLATGIHQLHSAVFEDRHVLEAEVQGLQRWQCLLASENSARSQYDVLIEQRRQGVKLPDGLLCLSGAGRGLHGLRQRPWAAEAGNIHLSVHLLPGASEIDSGIPFMVLAAISVVDAIDTVPGLENAAGIKWVNDILIKGEKVAGVLAYSEGTGKAVDAAVLGIGLNVETTPTVEGTPFVPSVSSLSDHVGDPSVCNQGDVFQALLESLDRNYQQLLDGKQGELIERYRQCSIVIGKEVEVCVDDASSPPRTIAEGRVEDIGENLELYLVGRAEPVTRGRLILKSEV